MFVVEFLFKGNIYTIKTEVQYITNKSTTYLQLEYE